MKTTITKNRARTQASPHLVPADKARERQEPRNRAYIEDGDIKLDIVTDTLSIKEAEELTLRAIELEYARHEQNMHEDK